MSMLNAVVTCARTRCPADAHFTYNFQDLVMWNKALDVLIGHRSYTYNIYTGGMNWEWTMMCLQAMQAVARHGAVGQTAMLPYPPPCYAHHSHFQSVSVLHASVGAWSRDMMGSRVQS
jgi:hypothetical protein